MIANNFQNHATMLPCYVGGFVVGEKTETALLYCKSSAVLAGVPFADAIFEQLDLQCIWNFDEGSYIDVVRDGGHNQRVVAAKVTGDSLINRLVLTTIFKLYFLNLVMYLLSNICIILKGKCRNILLAERTALNTLRWAIIVAILLYC
jgi:nicotinate-nucleotide pyrophosphorylase